MLEIKKTTRLEGNFKVGNELVKQVVVDIDEKGVSKTYDTIYNEQLYADNRKEMRKHEKEFRDKRYQVEDQILEELEAESETKEQS